MRILILGAGGMLGHKMVQELAADHELFATFRGQPDQSTSHPAFATLDRDHARGDIDARDMDRVAEVLAEVQPQAMVNCIGIVKQRDEAKAAIPSIQVNALFPHQLAELCQTQDTRLIHLSTDCVFSGNRGQYTEDDLPDPVDLYGRTKLIGEVDRPGSLTLRTSIIGWELKHYAGLLEWFASQRGRTIKGFRGAIYTGLSTASMARLIGELLHDHPDLSGLYQVASQPITKYDLLIRLRDALGWGDITIKPDDEFQCDRSLNGTRFESATGWTPPTWDEMISELAAERPVYQRYGETIQ